jgi:hypothetical protein
MDGVCRTHGENINTYKSLVRKSEGETPRGIPRRRCGDNITFDLKDIGFEMEAGFIWLGIGPVTDSCENCNKLSGSKTAEEIILITETLTASQLLLYGENWPKQMALIS